MTAVTSHSANARHDLAALIALCAAGGAMLLFLASVLFACSGAKSTNTVNSPPPAAPVAGTITPAGAYNITVVGSSGSVTYAAILVLNVK